MSAAGWSRGQSLYAEAEDQWESSCFVSCLRPQPVAVSLECHIGGAEQLLCQLEGLVVLQRDRQTLDGQRLAALLQTAHLARVISKHG
ncbi:hypothetical protein EYF80_001678 [Liparis tanakae]|uniref:Uncharacterized protein n=1 Tax=Liparis tanakae TaxID=230148 RepID=A0A4Z2JDP1_9TELE|nr:hypothetical protein EYF80_001678 [Liparis tanakae]